MNLITFRHLTALAALSSLLALAACGVSVEQVPGTMIPAAPAMFGQWRAEIRLAEVKKGVLNAEPAGEAIALSWSGDEAGGLASKARIFTYRQNNYVAIEDGAAKPGYFILKIVQQNDTSITLRGLDVRRADTLLKREKLPVVYKKLWLHNELYLSKQAFEKLLQVGESELFADGTAVTLSKVR
jgi:hypothetical protein